jgi:hypothetical protein
MGAASGAPHGAVGTCRRGLDADAVAQAGGPIGHVAEKEKTPEPDRRSGSGLNLLVHDAYTGGRRPVATLSGGEGRRPCGWPWG